MLNVECFPSIPWRPLRPLREEFFLPAATVALLNIRIRPQNFDEIAVFAQMLDRIGDLGVQVMPGAINEEEIFPRLAFAGTGFNLGQVDLELAEGANRFMQRARAVGDAQHEAGAVVAGGRTALAAQDDEAGDIVGLILNVFF